MKIYVNSSIVTTKPYNRKKSRVVTRNYIQYAFPNITQLQLNNIVEGIASWKREHPNIAYHHVDIRNSSVEDDRPDNVVLIDTRAHSFLHIPSTELKFLRCYDMMLPMHPFGPKAEARERELYTNIIEDIHDSINTFCGVSQIIDVVQNVYVSNPDFIPEDITDGLRKTNIRYITKDNVIELLSRLQSEKNIDFSSPPDLTYIDEFTAGEVINFLNKLSVDYSDNLAVKYSVTIIKQFIAGNTMEDDELIAYAN